MASDTLSSTTSSSPTPSEDSDDLTLELQPAPLRLPRRNLISNLDGSNSVDREQTPTVADRESTSTSTARRDSPSPPPQATIPKVPSQRRPPAPKLGTLVSKFEILDALNNAEVTSVPKARPSAIPRAQGALRGKRGAIESPQQTTTVEKRDDTGYSSDVSPRQVASPPPRATRSKLPVSTTFKTTTGRGDVRTVFHAYDGEKANISSKEREKQSESRISPTPRLKDDRRRLFEHKSSEFVDRISPIVRESTEAELIAYSPFSKSTNSALEQSKLEESVLSSGDLPSQQLPKSNHSQQNSPYKPKLQTTPSASSLNSPQKKNTDDDGRDHQIVEETPVKKREPPTLSRIFSKVQRPSVADLRKSFEQNSQPPRGAPQTPTKAKLSPEKTPTRESDKETLRSSGSTYREHIASARTITEKGTTVQTTSGAVGATNRTELRTKPSQRALRTPQFDTARHAPTWSLPRSSRFRRGGPRTLDGAISFEHEDMRDGGDLNETNVAEIFDSSTIRESKKLSNTSLIYQFLRGSPRASSRNFLASEKLVTDQASAPKQADRTPERAFKPELVTRCTGRVSDLRRIFERSAAKGSSPNSFKPFWRNRSRSKQIPEADEIHDAGYDPNESSTTLDTHITPLERIPVPELTTKIPNSDFSWDFTETLGDTGLMKPKAHFDTQVEEIHPIEQESPVKTRIQQFERLERGSPVTSLAPSCRAKSYDANLNSSFTKKENDPKQMKSRASWRPFRQRGVEMWRRISNPFRSVAGGNGITHNGEQAGSSNHVDTNNTRSHSVRHRLRYCRSDIFGYHLYHTSEVVRSSSSSCNGSSSDDELAEMSESQSPYLTYRRPPSSHLPMRRTFPFLARMSDDLGYTDEFDDFGFDGSTLSKAIRRRDKPSTTQASQRRYQSSSSPTPLGDPSTLSKVVTQQTTAERKRRRVEEKQLRQKERDTKREEKTKAKEKEMDDEERATNGQDKGKGKDIEGKKKERSWSTKTASGFVVRQINDIKLKHPKPRRPGQAKKIVNMYKDKSTSGFKLGKGSGISSGSGAGGASTEAVDN
ncbi:hypothetical protein F5Y13DRAFT_194420 [Hypoxylon sp. FL1857]|nr:hypothetical protein F5Y13DRAFT_194420 [Hypoxylon sp. FL1857]